MSGGCMEIAGFQFNTSDLDGYRLIESVFPDTIDKSRLWSVASSYPTLWDEKKPTVTINDLTAMKLFGTEELGVLKWVLQQNDVRAQLLATSWVTGPNGALAEQVRAVLGEVGR